MSAETTDGDQSTELDCNLTRRRALQMTALAAAATAGVGAGAGSVLAAFGDEDLDHASDYAHDPHIGGSVTVETHESDFGALDYIADDGSTTSLREDGYVIAEEDDPDTPHNPVTLAASGFVTEEYTAFPRGAKYDSDGDGDVDADDDGVRVVDATHWTKDAAGSAGTGSISDGSSDTLVVSTSSQTSGDTMVFEFDLSTVADSDQTITDGMSRLFLQAVSDITTLESGVTVEFAVIDSGGTEVTATYDPAGDTSTVGVMANAAGDSQVGQESIGALEDDAAVTLADIQKVQIRVNDANAEFTIQGLNLERSSKWEYGSQEYLDADSNVDTQTITEPSGNFSITDLASLGTAFDDAKIKNVTYDVEQRASELPLDKQHVRLEDLGDAYDRPHEIEIVYQFEAPSAYELDVSHGGFNDVATFPGRRYLKVEAASGVAELEGWDDVDDVAWTERTGDYSSVGQEVVLLSSVSATDRTVSHHRIEVDGPEADDMLGPAGAAVGTGGGGSALVNLKTVLLGVLGGLAVYKRKAIAAIFG